MVDLTDDDGTLFELALFAGAGGGILGGKLLGWRTICAVEINRYAASVLCARQNDGSLEPFPIWGDIRCFRSRNPDCRAMFEMLRAIRHRLVISGGFPCQDISVAGTGEGLEGERSGLWFEQARIIREIRPRFAWVENSPALTGRGLHRVLGDLAALGFDAQWGVLSAEDAIWSQGTPEVYHGRDRIWICGENADIELRRISKRRRAATARQGSKQRRGILRPVAQGHENEEVEGLESADYARIQQGWEKQWSIGKRTGPENQSTGKSQSSQAANIDSSGRREQRAAISDEKEQPAIERCGWWLVEPDMGRVANGVANRVDRLASLGNGQVPAVVELAWKVLTNAGRNQK